MQPDDERDKALTKLFAMYPPPPDLECSMASYRQDTRDIPTFFLRHAFALLRDEPVFEKGDKVPRRWLPTISEIRFAAARVIRTHKLLCEGRDPNAYSTAAAFFEPQRWIEMAPKVEVQIRHKRAELEATKRKELSA